MTDSPERLPPQDLEAERSLLGGLMISNTRIDDALGVLTADDFYSDAHRRIFGAMLRLRDRNRPFDAVTLGHELSRAGDFAEVGGAAYLAELLETVPHASHTEHYAGIVKDTSTRRRIIEASQDAIRRAHSTMDLDDLLTETDRDFSGAIAGAVHDEAESLSAVLFGVFDEIERATDARGDTAEAAAQPTGFEGIDRVCGGMFRSEFIILAARPSVGKSALMARIARFQAGRGLPVLIFSMEQPKLEVAQRFIAMETGINTYNLRKGELSERDHSAITEAAAELNALPITIDDRADMTLARIKGIARGYRRRGIGAIFIDYLQLIRADNPRDIREQQVSKISRGLKVLAKDLEVPVVVLAQLNREIEKRQDKRPRLSDLRESGAIEQDADQVWLLHRPDADELEREGEAALFVAKNRNGPTGVCHLYWENHCVRYSDYHGGATQPTLPMETPPDRGGAFYASF